MGDCPLLRTFLLVGWEMLDLKTMLPRTGMEVHIVMLRVYPIVW